ncbi:hypothetical protein N8314_00720 [Akkermansiaceae bacterium]|nr:hypothetical protein [Akkermansiaceae bacterium]
MGLETAVYIEDLVGSNPLGTDSKAQGDNHLRLIKNVLRNQFPSLGGAAVTATAAEINDLIDNNRGVPSGVISLWSGSVTTIPTGWALCNGGSGTPNLVNRFVIATGSDAGGSYNVGNVGGSSTQAGTTSGSTVLTLNQIPAHNHGGYKASRGYGGNHFDGTGFNEGRGNPDHDAQPIVTQGGNQGHTHSVPAIAGANIPPYYALAYIMKL